MSLTHCLPAFWEFIIWSLTLTIKPTSRRFGGIGNRPVCTFIMGSSLNFMKCHIVVVVSLIYSIFTRNRCKQWVPSLIRRELLSSKVLYLTSNCYCIIHQHSYFRSVGLLLCWIVAVRTNCFFCMCDVAVILR